MKRSLKTGIRNRFKSIRERFPFGPRHKTKDQVDLSLWGLTLSVSRETTSEVPSELTVVVPRAEFRHDCQAETGETGNGCNTEVLLNSITIVIAPRHPTEHGTASSKQP